MKKIVKNSIEWTIITIALCILVVVLAAAIIIGVISYFASKFGENRIHENAKTYGFADELSNDVKRPGVKRGLFRYT